MVHFSKKTTRTFFVISGVNLLNFDQKRKKNKSLTAVLFKIDANLECIIQIPKQRS